MVRNSFFFLIALSCAGAAAAAPAARVEIAYELSSNGSSIAEIVERLEHDGKTYRLSALAKGKGVLGLRGDVKRSSRGTIAADGLRPAEFEDLRPGRDPARAKFDWNVKTLTMQYKGGQETRPLPANAHDRLSFLYGFAFSPPAAQPVTLNVADGRGVSVYVFQSAGREKLRTPAGEFDTLKLVKRKDGPDDRGTEIWLAVGHGLLPLRILITEKDGTRIDQVASRISGI